MSKRKQMLYYDRIYRAKPSRRQSDVGWADERRIIDSTLLRLMKYFDDGSANILEVGIGKGDLAFKVSLHAGHRKGGYFGLDISKEGVDIARQKVDCPNFHVLVADATRLPFRSRQFGLAICSEVIEHIAEKRKLLHEIGRVLNERGMLLLTTPNPKALTYLVPKALKFIRLRYGSHQPLEEQIERKELASMLEEQNFDILIHTGTILKPYIVDLLEQRLGRPLVLIRRISERLERSNLTVFCLYQVLLARNSSSDVR